MIQRGHWYGAAGGNATDLWVPIMTIRSTSLMLAVGFILALPAYAQNRYVSDEYGFSIDFPAGWSVKGSTAKNTVIKAVLKDTQGRIAQIVVAAYPFDVKGDMWDATGQDMFEAFINDYPGVEAALLDSGKSRISGEHALWTDIDVKAPSIIAARCLSYHVIQKPILYRISYTADRDAVWFQAHLATAKAAVESFRLRGTGTRSPGITVSQESDSVLIALFKGYWQTLLIVLAAGIGVAIGRAFLGRIRRRPQSDSAKRGRERTELAVAAAQRPHEPAGPLMRATEKCSACRHANYAEAQFCARCGTSLQVEATSPASNPLRPRSLAVTSIAMMILFGGLYLVTVGLLFSGAQGLTFSRLIVEPPELEGGIPWPGWDKIGLMMRDELTAFERLAPEYWWAKMRLAGSLLLGPVFILGWLGVFMGREWGRMCLYTYAAAWLANKVIYVLLMGAAGTLNFSLAVGLAALLVLVLRLRSWSAWIESSRARTTKNGSRGAAAAGI